MSDAQSDPHPHLTSLLTKGYTLLPSLLSPSQLLALRAAASKLTTLARQGKWPHVRTLGKQFPPWDSALVARGERGIWGVQHLLHPELPLSQEEERGVFVGVYFDSRVLGVVQEVTGAQEGDLVMELMNMLVHPEGEGIRPLKGGGEGFELRWHRDDIPWTVGPEEEQALLDRQRVTVSIGGEERTVYNHAQWNIALYDDESLVVVPGSHLRSRTEVERNADPYEPNLPGMEVVKLKAGDAVFYDSNILHRGVTCSTSVYVLEPAYGAPPPTKVAYLNEFSVAAYCSLVDDSVSTMADRPFSHRLYKMLPQYHLQRRITKRDPRRICVPRPNHLLQRQQRLKRPTRPLHDRRHADPPIGAGFVFSPWKCAKEVLVAPVGREKIAGATILSQVFTLSSSELRMAVKAGGLAHKELGIEEDVLMELVKKGGREGGGET
ncbi:uncharacterized protein CTHT_0043100 [Thermochaetoides thermophila DSM 1495]|uniref:Phytanoyl-CoA dioxygenase family protein n=1 Tax=Chaetomium thermophilum (strain DSM 1495 / CBS 144.50 / IMI 039719) TaxID=759272 RepID=G0SAQ3_CHATD|nr:hypothetical protein CTHT_0043100 [Thermochaetoides thermophila DSM 1495]EGS19825.1 hypothetical protein CTHT_0043100 [Thermochaetoides thermophila DSM 1495]